MDERQIGERGGGYPPYSVPPPPRRGNTLRALIVLLGVALLAGFVLYSLLQIKEAITSGNVDSGQGQLSPPPTEQTVIIHKREKFTPYPTNRVQVAERFGGDPKDWSQNIWIASWKYKSDTPIEIPIARNVTVYSDNLTLYWE